MANNRVYEEFDPSVEWSRGAEAESVRISLPGFKREDIRVLVDSHGHLRTRGERAISGARWSRFQKDFQLPDNCNVDGIRAKFEAETLTITLPKKTPSPPVLEPPSRRPVAAAPSQRIPPPLPEAPARPAPTAVPAAALAPAAAAAPQRPPAERRPSLPRKPSITEPELPPRLPSVPTPAHLAAAKPDPAALAAAAQKAAKEAEEEEEEEEKKRMEREMMGKMEEDRKAVQQQRDEAAAAAAMGEMAMARQPRPASASRGLLVNVAVAVVVLLGITVYVWHNLRNVATGGGHGHLGAGSYGDEM